jgi:hypothetical protein
MIAGIHSLQLLHGLVPLPSTPIHDWPPERLDKVLVALVAIFGHRNNMVGSTSKPEHGKDLELFKFLLQPCVELPGTVETQVVDFVEIPHGDFAVEGVEVNEAAGVTL